MKSALKAVVLAAGKGTRLQSEGVNLPKVMRLAAGRPLLAHVLDALDFIPPEDRILVVGYKKESVMEAFPECSFAIQEQQLGTGHAVMAAYSVLGDFDGSILVCYGDMPLLKKETYQAVVSQHEAEGNACTLLSGTTNMDMPYGRILRDKDGAFCGVVEDKDASESQKAIKELNCGVYAFNAPALRGVLSELKQSNAQGEYYLTDAPLLLKDKGLKVGVCMRELDTEMLGVNTVEQLAQVEELLKK